MAKRRLGWDRLLRQRTDVHYQRLDGAELTLPCCNVFRFREGLIHDHRIYMDINPVIAP